MFHPRYPAAIPRGAPFPRVRGELAHDHRRGLGPGPPPSQPGARLHVPPGGQRSASPERRDPPGQRGRRRFAGPAL